MPIVSLSTNNNQDFTKHESRTQKNNIVEQIQILNIKTTKKKKNLIIWLIKRLGTSIDCFFYLSKIANNDSTRNHSAM